MFGWLSGNRSRRAIPDELYGAIVTQAREPALYADLGVPDTVAGRFEMVVLHTALALRRLGNGSAVERELGEAVFERFCADMDASLREFGVSDAVMGKRMKTMAQGYYGRAGAYGTAVDEDSRDELVAALRRNVFPGGEGDIDVRLGAYAIRFAAACQAVPEGAFETGAASFPRVPVLSS